MLRAVYKTNTPINGPPISVPLAPARREFFFGPLSKGIPFWTHKWTWGPGPSQEGGPSIISLQLDWTVIFPRQKNDWDRTFPAEFFPKRSYSRTEFFLLRYSLNDQANPFAIRLRFGHICYNNEIFSFNYPICFQKPFVSQS